MPSFENITNSLYICNEMSILDNSPPRRGIHALKFARKKLLFYKFIQKIIQLTINLN